MLVLTATVLLLLQFLYQASVKHPRYICVYITIITYLKRYLHYYWAVMNYKATPTSC
uniref:Uncharacterized protein n=1 Tax=Octopus bimaculoides TaxID=37653 RepID=A0A0L8ID26_OCTBM